MYFSVVSFSSGWLTWRGTILLGDVIERVFWKSPFYFINEPIVWGDTCLSTFAKRPNKIYENILREINCCFLPESKFERHHPSRGLLLPPGTNNPQYDARLASVHEALQDLHRTLHFSWILLSGKIKPMIFCCIFTYYT